MSNIEVAPPPMRAARVTAEALTVLFMAAVVAAADGFHLFYVLFPELGALSSDVFLRPTGKWAKEPWKLIATPTAAATAGIFVGRLLPYGLAPILLAMTAGIAIVFVLRSNVAPAISAAVLPIVLGITSWRYPLCILCTLSVLAAALAIWRRTPSGRRLIPTAGPDEKATELLESPPRGRWWLAALYVFVAAVGLVAQLTSWRFILFPPLVVIAYEMLGHPNACPWAKPPYTFPLACSLSALAGVLADWWLGVTPVAAILVLSVSIGMLRLLRLSMPPVLAIGLIPFVIPKPTLAYPASVAIGTLLLTGWFLLYRRLLLRPHERS